MVKLQDVKGGDDAADARWFPVQDTPKLAFDHDLILRDALCRLRERIHFHPNPSPSVITAAKLAIRGGAYILANY